MTLDEILETDQAAARPSWRGEKFIVVMNNITILFSRNSYEAPDWTPSEDLKATDWIITRVNIADLRGYRIIGQFLSEAEEEKRREDAEIMQKWREVWRNTFEIKDGALCLKK